MSQYDNSNSGALFRNTRKELDTHADYTGGWTDANGVEYYLSAWLNEDKNGNKYFKLRLGNPKDQGAAPAAQPRAAAPQPVVPEDIPF